MATTAAMPAPATTRNAGGSNEAVTKPTKSTTKRKRLGHTAADPADMAGTCCHLVAA